MSLLDPTPGSQSRPSTSPAPAIIPVNPTLQDVAREMRPWSEALCEEAVKPAIGRSSEDSSWSAAQTRASHGPKVLEKCVRARSRSLYFYRTEVIIWLSFKRMWKETLATSRIFLSPT